MPPATKRPDVILSEVAEHLSRPLFGRSNSLQGGGND